MQIDNAFPSKYIKASDLNGTTVRVLIDRVEIENVGGGDRKPVLYFQGKVKGMVLNRVNSKNISSAYGGETDEWHGKEIVLFEALVDFQGESKPAIRVRAPTAKDRQQRPQQGRNELTPVVNGSNTKPIGGETWDPPRAAPKHDIDDQDIPF